MKYRFIVNPVAGKGKAAARLTEEIREYAQNTGISYEICLTSGQGDATRIARRICAEDSDEKIIFACGGDGMVSEVASGLAGCETAVLGVIPTGTGNDFVRSFAFPKLFTNLDAQLSGETVLLDAIRYTGDNGLHAYSLNVLNMGFDCHVVACAARAKKFPLLSGSMAYYAGILMSLVSKPGLVGEISVDGGEFEPFDLMFLLAANGRFYGGGYCPAPYALMQDGKIDLALVQNVSRTELFRLLGSYREGTFLIQPHVVKKNIADYRRCERITVRFPKPTGVCGDGEITDTEILHAEICPKAIRFLLPRGSALPKDDKAEEAESVLNRSKKK